MTSDKYHKLMEQKARWQKEVADIDAQVSPYEAWQKDKALHLGDELLINRDFCRHWLETCQSPIHLLGGWIKDGFAIVHELDMEHNTVGITSGYGSWSIPLDLALNMRQAWLLKNPPMLWGSNDANSI